ncbi:MAG TPA: hypothetical protein VHW23_12505 [Kofleriaceae bacterium]|jgi:hypothetical protein|nr:hypothetical protein [Kofleriaceae bacterium]
MLAVLAVLTVPGTPPRADPAPEPSAAPASPPAPTDGSPPSVPVVERESLSQAGISNTGDILQGAIAQGNGSRRGIANDYLVMPSGGELTGAMRFVTTDQPALGTDRLRFSDLALLDLAGRWSVIPRLEVSGQIALVPKQPSTSSEKVWQRAGIGLHTPLGDHVALALDGAGGHLLDHTGTWESGSLLVQWRKTISEFVQFDVAGGADVTDLRAPRSTSAQITELATAGSIVFHETWRWGAWIGVGYAVPIDARGTDPTTALAVDPRPRVDLRLGTVLAVSRAWDVFAEYEVVDRGDLAAPATRLPILDGGFDQRQFLLGVTRHIEASPPSPRVAAR